MMQRGRQPLMLLCSSLTVALVIHISGSVSQTEDAYVQGGVFNLTNRTLTVIPTYNITSNFSILMIKENMITLNETDKEALASYSTLAELYLDGNGVTDVPAHFFSVVPHLQVLSLSNNRIHRVDPEAFEGLSALIELDLSHNNLTSLPSQLLGTMNLKKLQLQGNPWNCSCSLLSSIREIAADNINIGSLGVTCVSPNDQAGKNLSMALASCDQIHGVSTDPPTTQTPATLTTPTTSTTSITSQQSTASSTTLMKTQSSGQNLSTSEQTPGLGNSWKFTACIVALALTTCTLIICSIKGPSWYKLFHNYRHRPLRTQYEEEEDNMKSTNFANIGRRHNHQTFSFTPQDGQMEEDEYYEDPFVNREE